jgi:mevalonate kinase
MGITNTTAPGKLILCGEHAVVYGCPAIALPLNGVRARVQIVDGAAGSGVCICARDLEREWIAGQSITDPLGDLAFATFHHLGTGVSDVTITITSDIPIAGGLGSGAAVATALVRGLATHLGRDIPAETVSNLVYCSEQRYHGTPSGIDNTVIAFERPIWFVRQRVVQTSDEQEQADAPQSPPPPPIIEPVKVSTPFTLLIGDTGVRSKTRLPVAEVRRRWIADPQVSEELFAQVAALVHEIRLVLTTGDIPRLGMLLNTNQHVLQQMGVSSPELEQLVDAALAAGALGAKLSGAGWGGVMLALVDELRREAVASALRRAGAARVMQTVVT